MKHCFCLALVSALLFIPRLVPAQTPPPKPSFEAATGKIELLSDGSFGNFTNQHNWARPYGWAKGAFAAIRAQAGTNAPVAKMLRVTSVDEYAGVANVSHTRMQGWFPRAQIDYVDADLPIKIRLDAFSPLIPHNPKDSSLPVACLSYTLTNLTAQTVQASILLAWPNLLGWGGRAARPALHHHTDL